MNLLMPDQVVNGRRRPRPLPDSPVELLIVTRFNLFLPQYTAGWSEQQRQAWSEDRLPLFRQLCVRSVANQGSRDFHWLVLCDALQPEAADAVAASLADLGEAQVLRCGRDLPSSRQIQQAVRGFVASRPPRPGREWICTARLDCDDGLHGEYVANLHLYARHYFVGEAPRLPVCLSFNLGVQLHRDRLQVFSYPNNPFIGLVEPAGTELKTVYCGNHGFMYEQFAMAMMHTRQPMWLRNVHGRNLMNGLYADALPLRLNDRQRTRLFGSNLRAPPPPPAVGA